MKLYINDLQAIGFHTDGGGDKKTTRFIVDGEQSRIEKIILREILALEGYSIISFEDAGGDFEGHVLIQTDFPFDRYMKLDDD